MNDLVSTRGEQQVIGVKERPRHRSRIETVLDYHDTLLDTWLSMGAPDSQRWIVSGWGSAESQSSVFVRSWKL